MSHPRSLSPEAEEVLRAAGWFPGRRVSTAEWEKLLRDDGGFEIHEAARQFLEEFGGLSIPRRGPGLTMTKKCFATDPASAVGEADIFLESLSPQAGAYLYPVGEVEECSEYMGMAPDGTVYSGVDWIVKMGKDGFDALDNLILGVNPAAPPPG